MSSKRNQVVTVVVLKRLPLLLSFFARRSHSFVHWSIGCFHAFAVHRSATDYVQSSVKDIRRRKYRLLRQTRSDVPRLNSRSALSFTVWSRILA